MRLILWFVSLVFAFADCVYADSLTVVPASPTSNDVLILRIYAFESSFPYYDRRIVVSQNGSAFDVYACRAAAGFATGGLGLNADVPLGHVSPGLHTATLYKAFCDVGGLRNVEGLDVHIQFTVIAAVTPEPITPQAGVWWNPAQPGTGYAIDVRHGVLVMTVYSYNGDGTPTWYLVSGPLVNNEATLDLGKYRFGQCLSCGYSTPGVYIGSEGTATITFTSPTTATMQLPGDRVFVVVPFDF